MAKSAAGKSKSWQLDLVLNLADKLINISWLSMDLAVGLWHVPHSHLVILYKPGCSGSVHCTSVSRARSPRSRIRSLYTLQIFNLESTVEN